MKSRIDKGAMIKIATEYTIKKKKSHFHPEKGRYKKIRKEFIKMTLNLNFARCLKACQATSAANEQTGGSPTQRAFKLVVN